MRTVPLSDKAYKTFQKVLDNPYRPKDTELLFYGETSKSGKSRNPYTFSKAWRKAHQRAKIKEFKFHDLRHEATSRLVEAGLSDQQVMTITGHSSAQMLRRYTHLRGGDLVSLVKDI